MRGRRPRSLTASLFLGGAPPELARWREILVAPLRVVPLSPETKVAFVFRLTGVAITRCPVCRAGRLHVVDRLRPAPLAVPGWDTS